MTGCQHPPTILNESGRKTANVKLPLPFIDEQGKTRDIIQREMRDLMADLRRRGSPGTENFIETIAISLESAKVFCLLFTITGTKRRKSRHAVES